jgi:hypothetical protein
MNKEKVMTYEEQCEDLTTHVAHHMNINKQGHELKCGLYITNINLNNLKKSLGTIHKRSKLPAMLSTFFTEVTVYKLMRLLKKDNMKKNYTISEHQTQSRFVDTNIKKGWF